MGDVTRLRQGQEEKGQRQKRLTDHLLPNSAGDRERLRLALADQVSHTLDTINELAARWQRANAEGSVHGPRTLHTHGRMEGYVQAISLSLGVECKEVRAALESGLLPDA